MELKKKRGRKPKGFFHTGDSCGEFLHKETDRFLSLKKKKEDVLNSFKIVIGSLVHRARNGLGMTLEELGLKIGVGTSQLRGYESGETSLSAARLFLAISFLFHNRPPEYKEDFLKNLTNNIEGLFYDRVKGIKRDTSVKNVSATIAKTRQKLQEQMLLLDPSELRKILSLTELVNKNKKKKSKDSLYDDEQWADEEKDRNDN
jgi:transcriptional regulator with XRE-family HTH domain